jgi:hypothetical protein
MANKKLEATVDSRAGFFDEFRPIGRSSTAASVLTFDSKIICTKQNIYLA